MAQRELHPTTDTTQGPLAPEAQVQLRFEKFTSFVEEFRPKISLGGMFLETGDLKPVGTTMSCEFKLTDGFRLCQALGEVIWVRREAAGPVQPAGMGIRFQAIDDKGRELVLKILEEQVKAGGEPFEVERIPPGVETAPAAGPSPREDPASTMSRPVVSVTEPGEDPASTRSRAVSPASAAPEVPAIEPVTLLEPVESQGPDAADPLDFLAVDPGSSAASASPAAGLGDAPWGDDLPELPAEVIADDAPAASSDLLDLSSPDPAFALETDGLEFEPLGEAPPAPTPAAPISFDGPEEISFTDISAEPSFDTSEPLPPAPELNLGGPPDETPAFAPEIDALALPDVSERPLFDAELPQLDEPAFGGELPETLAMPALKEEPTGPGTAWSLEPDPADTAAGESIPGLDRPGNVEEAVAMDPDLFNDDLPDHELGDELPDGGLGGDAHGDAFPGDGLSDFGTPEPASGYLEAAGELPEDEDWEEDDEWDDEEEEESRLGGFFRDLQLSFSESKGRILAILVVVVAVGAGLLFKDRLMELAGFGPSAEPAPLPASPPPASAEEPSPAPRPDAGREIPPPETSLSEAQEPEVIVAEPPSDTSSPPAAAEPPPAPPPRPAPPPPRTPPPERGPEAPPNPSSGPARQVRQIRFEQTPQGTKVTVQLDGQLPESGYVHNELSYDALKEQIVLLGLTQPYASRVDVGTLELDRIRTGLHGDRLNLVFDFSAETMAIRDIRHLGDRLEFLVRRR